MACWWNRGQANHTDSNTGALQRSKGRRFCTAASDKRHRAVHCPPCGQLPMNVQRSRQASRPFVPEHPRLQLQPPPRWAPRPRAPAGKVGEEDHSSRHRLQDRCQMSAVDTNLHMRTVARQPAMLLLPPHLRPGLACCGGERRTTSRSCSRLLGQQWGAAGQQWGTAGFKPGPSGMA